MNGIVEATNENIKKIFVKMTNTYKDWHEFLHLPCAPIALLFVLPRVQPHIPWCTAWKSSSP